jgi:hypothetical protein
MVLQRQPCWSSARAFLGRILPLASARLYPSIGGCLWSNAPVVLRIPHTAGASVYGATIAWVIKPVNRYRSLPRGYPIVEVNLSSRGGYVHAALSPCPHQSR